MSGCDHPLCAGFAVDPEDPVCLYPPEPIHLNYGPWPTGACTQCGTSCVSKTDSGEYLHPRCTAERAAPRASARKKVGAYARLASRRSRG